MQPKDLANLIEEHTEYCVMTYDNPEFAERMMNSMNHFAMCIATKKIAQLTTVPDLSSEHETLREQGET